MVATFSATLWGGLLTLHGTELLTKFLPGGLAGLKAVAAPDDLLSLRLNSILINTGACYLVAFLSGHLAGQLLLSRRALDASQANLGRLADLNELIIQSIDSGLVTTSRDGLVLTVNRPGLKILGLTLEEMIGRPWWSLFLPGPARAIPLSNRRGPAAEDGGLRFKYARKNDGRELTLELSVLALINSSEETWGRLFVLKDLTSFIKMEEEVHKAEHLAALGEMAAGLAHELRTPLASLTGAWHMLAQDAPDQEDRRRLSGIIGREMDRLAKLTNDFLSFARPVRGKPGFFDLPALAADQLAVFSRAKRPGLQLESRFQPVPAAFFDRDHFCQIVWNLLTNALEAGARQEKLNIIVETGRDPAWPRHIAFKVANDGPPIPPENRDRLFEPFFTTKSTGNGLGLATVSRLLHEGGGDITVDFTPSAFTTFTVFFPTAPRSAA
jgi:two-component system sensor histidine kinase PilS (NtrC family)